jgi:phosphohistidine phosphatase
MDRLLLIRHGLAEDPRPGLPDADRALTREGWERTRAAMKGLVARGLVPTRGFYSPYRRASETMSCLQEAVGAFPMEVHLGLMPEGRPPQADLWLRGLLAESRGHTTLALISHQPFLGALIFYLTGRSLEVKKASCTVIHWEDGVWRFKEHVTPSALRG